MIHYSIATRTDPDLGNDAGLDKHTAVTDLFAAKLQELCDYNCIYDNEHERAEELYERAAFDTALAFGVEFVREETSPNEVTFCFNFVPTIKITKIEPDEVCPECGIEVSPHDFICGHCNNIIAETDDPTPPGKCADCPEGGWTLGYVAPPVDCADCELAPPVEIDDPDRYVEGA